MSRLSYCLRRVVFGLFVLPILFTQAALAQAQRDDVVNAGSLEANASFSHSVGIEAPDYYGIEPSLAIHYNVNSPVGLAGPGWDLTGFSVIDRKGPTAGLPVYTAGDRYFLDGQELIACTGTATASPGCALGGTHVTKSETYQRVVRTGDTFVVCKSGVCSTYQPVICNKSGVYRWGVSQVADLLGHVTTYAWDTANSCTGNFATSVPQFAYPKSVTYNKGRYVVEVRYDNSVTRFPHATGAGDFVRSKRVKNIAVKVTGRNKSAWGLSYQVGNDVLSKIQPYGTDVTFDAAGTINGGSTAAPAQTFIAESTAVSFGAAIKQASISCPRNGNLSAVDLNGDGFSDLVCVHARTNSIDSVSGIEVFTNLKNGTFAPAVALPYPGDSKKEPVFIDINCDRRPDIAWVATTCPQQWKARLNQGDGTFAATAVSWGNLPTDIDMRVSAQFSDLNGDGCTEYVYPSTTNPNDRLYRIMYGQPNQASDTDTCLSTAQPLMGLPAEAARDGFGVTMPFRLTDVDGNGAGDLVYFKDTNTNTAAEVKAVLGSGYAINQATVSLGLMSSFHSLTTMAFARVAQGRGTDLVYIKAGQGRVMVRPWNNALQQFGTDIDVAAVPTAITVASLGFGDFDGDGKQDLLLLQAESATLMRPWVLKNTSGNARVTEIQNGMGGIRRLTYANAAVQPNTTGVPAQWVVATSTEIIGSLTMVTNYTYSGGLYDTDEKRFIGFSKVTRTDPCVGTVCPRTTVYFDTDYTGARPIRIDRFDATGNKLLASTTLRYSLKNTLPYDSKLIEKWDYAYHSASTAARRTAAEYTYNGNGDLASVLEYGDSATPLRLRVTDYTVMNAASFISQPSRTALYEGGAQTEAAKLEETLNSYDAVGKLTKKDVWVNPMPVGATTNWVSTTYSYDLQNRLIQIVAPLNRLTKFTYETELELFIASTTNARNHVDLKSWNSLCGQPAVATGVNGETLTFTYDAYCRPTLKTFAPGGHYEKSIYVVGTATVRQNTRLETPSADGAGVQWTESYFDGAGRVFETRTKGVTTIVQSKTFDALGRVATESLPYFLGQTAYNTSYKYDALGRRTETTFATGDKTTTAYGDRFICVTDEEAHQSCSDLDSLGRIIGQRQLVAGGRWVTSTLTYNARGDRKSLRDALGNTVTTDYDSLGHSMVERDPTRGTTTRAYNAAGEVVREVNGLGEVTAVEYDALGRVTKRTTREGTVGAQVVTFTYDTAEIGFGNVGHVTRAADTLGSTAFRYNVTGTLNRMVRHFDVQGDTPPADQTFTYAYDVANRPTQTVFPDGTALNTAYDASARPKSLTFVQGATNKVLASATYDAAGNKTALTYENGFSTAFTYAPQRNFLTQRSTTAPSVAGPQVQFAYTRNKEGKITGLSRLVAPATTAEQLTYTYDTRHQLLSTVSTVNGTQAWTYDDIGRVLTSPWGTSCYTATSAAYPAPHAIRGVGSCTTPSYDYNAIGAMTRGWVVPNNPSAGIRNFTYNGRGQVERLVISGAAGEQTYQEDYVYGANDQRGRLRVLSGSCAPADAQTTYFVDGDFEIGQVGGTDVTTQLFSLGGEMVAKRVKVEAGKRCASCTKTTTDTFTYLHVDHLGSVVAESKADRTLVNQANYRSFGDELNQPVGPTARLHRGFLGERRDATGLMFLNARYYDAALGQFISTDPLRNWTRTVGPHPYAYSFNDPINRSDANGAMSLKQEGGQEGGAEGGGASKSRAVGSRPFDKVDQAMGFISRQAIPGDLTNAVPVIPTADEEAVSNPDVDPSDLLSGANLAFNAVRGAATIIARGLLHALKSSVGSTLAAKAGRNFCGDGNCGPAAVWVIDRKAGQMLEDVEQAMASRGNYTPRPAGWGGGSTIPDMLSELGERGFKTTELPKSSIESLVKQSSENAPVLLFTTAMKDNERHVFVLMGERAMAGGGSMPMVADMAGALSYGPVTWQKLATHYSFEPLAAYKVTR